MDFSKLDYKDSIFQINSKKPFGKIHFENTSIIKDIFNFANDMTFRFVGEHRSHRTGGTHRRKKGEIFSDTFQGKLSEYATYQVLKKNSLNTDKPNLERYKLGKWDSGDMVINEKKIAIKSAKHFSYSKLGPKAASAHAKKIGKKIVGLKWKKPDGHGHVKCERTVITYHSKIRGSIM